MSWKSINWMTFSTTLKTSLIFSFNYHFPIIGTPTFYNPYLKLFVNSNLNNKRLNHQYQIVKIHSVKTRINKNISIRNVTITKYQKKKKNVTVKRRAFVKEIPFIPFRHFILLNKYQQHFRMDIVNFLINNNIYSFNNSAFIELFANFLISNLVENNINPHFPKLYGSINCLFKTYSYTETDNPSEIYPPELLKNNTIIIKNAPNQTYSAKVKKCPILIIVSENLDISLGNLLLKYNYYKRKWKAFFFQIVTAISIIQTTYKLTHNDLHISNIMCKKTKRQYLYYQNKKKDIYKIPTYGYILKITDWGRARLEINLKEDILKLTNNCFKSDFEVAGQYYPNTLSKSSKKSITTNFSFDLTLFAFDLLRKIDSNINDDFIDYLNYICTLRNKTNITKKYKKLSYKLYIDIATYATRACPSEMIYNELFNNIFQEFIIPDSQIKPYHF